MCPGREHPQGDRRAAGARGGATDSPGTTGWSGHPEGPRMLVRELPGQSQSLPGSRRACRWMGASSHSVDSQPGLPHRRPAWLQPGPPRASQGLPGSRRVSQGHSRTLGFCRVTDRLGRGTGRGPWSPQTPRDVGVTERGVLWPSRDTGVGRVQAPTQVGAHTLP